MKYYKIITQLKQDSDYNMPNPIKYNTSAETLALKKGNFWIGTGDVGKGPTNVTGYYNGITPPAGGFTIYLNKATSGPSIYTVSTEAQLVSLTNTIGAQSFTTSGQCLNWFATQTDKMVFNIDYPAIVTDGLVLNLDAGFTPSYPTTATTWYDVSSYGNNCVLVNGPTFSSDGGGSILFDGTDDYVTIPYDSSMNTNYITLSVWIKSTFKIGPSTRHYVFDGLSHYSMIFIDEPNAINFVIAMSSGPYIYAIYNNPITSENSWINIVGTYDGIQLSLYVNGNLVATNEYTGTLRNSSSDGRIMDFIGNGYETEGNATNFMMYNRALTATEVLQNYNATKGRFGL